METTVRKISWYSFLTLIMVVIISVLIWYKPIIKINQSLGGSAGEPYNATTTYSGQPTLLYAKAGQGTLGRLTITKAGAGTGLNYMYDATTTNNNLRTVSAATSSIILAAWPGNLAAGDYTFDELFVTGLLIENNTGTSVGSSTISWR